MLKLRVPLPRFFGAGEVVMGAGSVGALRALGAARTALLVSRSVAAQPQVMDRLRRAVGTLELHEVVMPTGEPTLEALQPVLAALAPVRPDWIVAVGGGSVIDGAKLAWTLHEHPDLEPERLLRAFALPDLRGQARFAAVPTTAGTGSEVSSAAVLALPDGGKHAVVSHTLLPDLVVLDPQLLAAVPAAVMAAAGCDALAHAVEGYLSRHANPLADHFAESAVGVLLDQLPRAVADPGDADTVLEVQTAALMAGWVQNLKLPGLGHAVAHQLGALGLGHGAACGLVLSAALEVNAQDAGVAARLARLARRVGLKDAQALLLAVRQLTAALGFAHLSTALPGGAAQWRGALPMLTAGALADPCAAANPVPVTPELVQRVLNHAD
jgi:alcohol dehydrogenase